jgi:hypothetical protein
MKNLSRSVKGSAHNARENGKKSNNPKTKIIST